MKNTQVLVTDYEYENLEPEKQVLEDIGVELLNAQCKTEQDIVNYAPDDIDGLIVQYAKVGEKIFQHFPNLKVVARYGIGVDTIDVVEATKHGVAVVNVAEYCQDEVADHVVALLLALARKVVTLNNSVKNGEWELDVAKPIGRIRGKKLGLMGFGSIARRVATRAVSFGLGVTVYDPYIDKAELSGHSVKKVDLNTVLSESDYISIHTPLNKETENMIGNSELERMKDSAVIINTSRGGVIDERALIAALDENKIAGAGLDVTQREPVDKDNPLLDMEEVVITPHVGWYSEESKYELKTRAAQGVAAVLQNEKPKYLVNEEVWEDKEI